MPRKNKTFGNWLDKKAAPPSPESLLASEAEKENFRQEKQVHELKVIFALCDHYSISAEEPGIWAALALNLARDFVPAMQSPKPPGSKKDWGIIELLCLDILVNRAKRQRKPDIPSASVFNETLIRNAKETRLKELVEKNDVNPKTLHNKHLHYLRSPGKAIFDKMFGLIETEEEKEQFENDLLQGRI